MYTIRNQFRTKQENGGKIVKKIYRVQVNDYMTPVVVELTESEAQILAYVLEEIARGDEDALVGLWDDASNEIYGNYDEWIKTHKEDQSWLI